MSFGFSVGDFLAVGRLIYEITGVLRESQAEYQELVVELEILQKVLESVASFKGFASQAQAIDDVNAAVVACRRLLERFAAKLQKYDPSLGLGRSTGKLKDAGRMLQWAYGKREEIETLRKCLNVHVGAINMHLIQLEIESHKIVSEEARADRLAMMKDIKESKDQSKQMRDDINMQTVAATESRSVLQTMFAVVGSEIANPLKLLRGTLDNILEAIQRISIAVIEIRDSTRCIDAQFTWFQAPIRVEDALGRTFPWPAECSVEALCMELEVRFKDCPDLMQAYAGTYELFYVHDMQNLITMDKFTRLIPGKTINMSIIRTVDIAEMAKCPMPRCKSDLLTSPDGTNVCSGCGFSPKLASLGSQVNDRNPSSRGRLHWLRSPPLPIGSICDDDEELNSENSEASLRAFKHISLISYTSLFSDLQRDLRFWRTLALNRTDL